MEEARYWMLAKQTHDYHDDSWEEKVFAEDAAGMLGSGGCVWPPRSYSCSFCRREFRSAQALGGHMNVHRRDRAKLKQFPAQPNNRTLNNPFQNHRYHNQAISSYLTFPANNSDRKLDCALSFRSPNPLIHPSVVSIPQKVEKISTPASRSPSSFIVSHEKNSCLSSPINEFSLKDKNFGGMNDKQQEKPGVPISLVFQQKHTIFADDHKHVDIRNKRRKLDVTSPPVIHKLTNEGKVEDQTSHTYDSESSSLGELDLELRLGDRPKG